MFQRRGVAGVRRLLGDFIRAVHPDLATGFPEEARRVNQGSLAQLNAFIDLLETSQVRRGAPLRRAVRGARSLEEGPETPLQLPFFQAFVTRLGRVLPSRVRPLQLQVPSLPAQASENEKERKPRHSLQSPKL